MIRSVAGDEFVEKSRGDVGIQTGDKAGARANEVCLDVFEVGGAVAPQGIGGDGAPRVVDVTEGETVIVGDVVVDADEFFPPGRGKRNGLDESGNGSASAAANQSEITVGGVGMGNQ